MTNSNPLLKNNGQFINLLSDNSGFKKGMTAYEVRVWDHDRETGRVQIQIRELQIQSFGKIQGTALLSKGDKWMKRNLNDGNVLAHTLEDAHQMAEELGLHESAHRLSIAHDFQKEWVSTLRESGPAEAVKKARELSGVSPSFEIV